jgi:hypothetical protein
MPECGVFGSLRPRGFSNCGFQTVDILLNCSVKVRAFCDGHTAKRFRWQFRKELMGILRCLLLYVSGAQKLLRAMVAMFLSLTLFCCFKWRKWRQSH